jgi:very-short-patch-repair endonuclease
VREQVPERKLRGLETSHLPPPGQVQVVFAPSVGEVLEQAKEWCAAEAPARRMVVHRLAIANGLDDLIHALVGNLADVAMALWPDWYGGRVVLPDTRLLPSEFSRLLGDALLASGLTHRDVMPSWARRASSLCRRGKPPRPRGFTPEVEASQLARAIEPDDLLVIVGVESVQPELLFGLARGVEWFAKATASRLLMVVPETVVTSEALDGITFRAVHWAPSTTRLSDLPLPPPDERTDRVWPTVGMPHPFSPGEQLLALRLADDPELAGLFGYNMAVRSRFGRLYFADLVWEAGQLIVEIDGYGHHSSRQAFAADRQRDYELSASGYLTLRIPHDEIMIDCARAIAKIRTLVELCRSRHSAVKAHP